MRVFWIIFVLVECVTCGPVLKGYQSTGADSPYMWQPFSSGYLFGARRLRPGPGRSLPLESYEGPDLPAQKVISSATSRSYSGTDLPGDISFNSGYTSFTDEYDNTHELSDYEASQPARSHVGGYSDPAGAYDEEGFDGFVSLPLDETAESDTNYDASDDNPELVFSDMSDLEPVYSLSSRSRYQRGRAVFAQTHYVPGESTPPFMPVPRRVHKTSLKQSGPPKAPAKGGF